MDLKDSPLLQARERHYLNVTINTPPEDAAGDKYTTRRAVLAAGAAGLSA